MGYCNLQTGVASFTWYLNIYSVNMQNGSANAQVLMMNATASNGNLPSAATNPAPGELVGFAGGWIKTTPRSCYPEASMKRIHRNAC